MPGYIYDILDDRRHRDVMQRVWKGAVDDRYLSPWDGHVAKLVVQATDEVYSAPNNVTWRRTFVRNVSPIMLRLANWPISSVTVDATQWTDQEWTSVCLKWLPACVALMAVVCTIFIGLRGFVSLSETNTSFKDDLSDCRRRPNEKQRVL